MEIGARKPLRAADYVDLSLIGSTHGLSDGFSSLLIPVLALIVAELGLSASRTGLLLSISSIAAFVVIYPVSLIADHGGRRKGILLMGMAVASIGFFLMRWAGSFWAVAVLALAAGAGNAVYHPCGTSLTAERFPAHRAFAISAHGLMGNIGASIMPVIQASIAVMFDWRAAIAVCALPALLLLPLVAVRFPSGAKSKAADTSVHPIRSLLAISSRVFENKNVLLLAVVYALRGMGAKALLGFVPLLAAQKLGMSVTLVGTGLTLYFGAGIAAKPLMGYLYARWGARTALVVPLIAAGALSLGIGMVSSVPVLLALLIVSGLVGPISPIILTAASDLAHREILASSVGLIYTCYGLGFLSPLAAGWLTEQFGIIMPFILSTVLIWIAALISLKLPSKNTPSPFR